MAYQVPDGSNLYIGLTFAAAIAITDISNANPAVATSAAHGLVTDAEFVLISGWQEATNRVFRVGAAPATGTFPIARLDTLSAARYNIGGGAGRAIPILTWQEVQQAMSPTSDGGEQQFATADPLALRRQVRVPTSVSAQGLTIPIADDITLPGYLAWKAASEAGAPVPIKIVKPNGEANYFYGLPTLNETPTFTKGEIQTVTATFSPQGAITRYPGVQSA